MSRPTITLSPEQAKQAFKDVHRAEEQAAQQDAVAAFRRDFVAEHLNDHLDDVYAFVLERVAEQEARS